MGCPGMLNFITHATGDDHINDARFDEFDEAINKLIFGRTFTVERIGVARNITAMGIDRALEKGPTMDIFCCHVLRSHCRR